MADTEVSVKVLVLAGSYEQYRFYLRESGNNPSTHRYIATQNDLCGFTPPIKIIRYGTWYKRGFDMRQIEALETPKGGK